jgi:hypothetical protein
MKNKFPRPPRFSAGSLSRFLVFFGLWVGHFSAHATVLEPRG